MYTAEQFLSDIDNIGNQKYSEISANKADVPEDLFLKYRQQFVLLLSSFKTNNFEQIRNISNENSASLIEFIHNFNTESLKNENPQPPFDFFLLVFMNASNSGPSFSLFIKLFQHYIIIRQFLINYDGEFVFINDRTRQSEIMMPLSDAKSVIQSRINYIAENIVSLLYSTGQQQLLLTFLTDFCLEDSFIEDEVTLSQLGRSALACGDDEIADRFFSKVKDQQLVSANNGYKNFYGSKFANAKKDFEAAGPAGPSNLEACSKYMGQFTTDPSDQGASASKKLTAEEKTQWPLQPRV